MKNRKITRNKLKRQFRKKLIKIKSIPNMFSYVWYTFYFY